MQDAREYLSTVAATDTSLKPPTVEDTRDMTEEERRAALEQFAGQVETASANDIIALLSMHQPAVPVSASPQHGGPTSTTDSNNGDTTAASHASTGPNQEPPKPDNGSCSC